MGYGDSPSVCVCLPKTPISFKGSELDSGYLTFSFDIFSSQPVYSELNQEDIEVYI
uniref:Uncharacterized protein n=1 Tax=Octopus bimaculoides TaxID=37653 RepID=A0A0L8HZU4_OCTBM